VLARLLPELERADLSQRVVDVIERRIENMALSMPEAAGRQIRIVGIIAVRQVFLLDLAPCLLPLGRCRIRIRIDVMLEFVYRYAVWNEDQRAGKMIEP